jgi:hypothetical protein
LAEATARPKISTGINTSGTRIIDISVRRSRKISSISLR